MNREARHFPASPACVDRVRARKLGERESAQSEFAQAKSLCG